MDEDYVRRLCRWLEAEPSIPRQRREPDPLPIPQPRTSPENQRS